NQTADPGMIESAGHVVSRTVRTEQQDARNPCHSSDGEDNQDDPDDVIADFREQPRKSNKQKNVIDRYANETIEYNRARRLAQRHPAAANAPDSHRVTAEK